MRRTLLAAVLSLAAASLAAAQTSGNQTGQSGSPQSGQLVTWMRQNAIPLRIVEAGHGFADLQPLQQVLKDVRIVGLGEATHGTKEFFQFKHRMLEFLVTQMNFNAFAIESSYAACQPINDYILYGKGDHAAVLSGQGYVAWDTEEFARMVEWLRTYNKSVRDEKKVRFYGLDLWYNRLGREKLFQYLGKHSSDKSALTSPLFQTLSALEAKWPMQITDEDRTTMEKVLPQLEALINHFTSQRDKLVNASSLAEFEQVLQYTRVMRQWVKANIAKSNAVRSAYMAENLEYLIDRAGPAARFVIWAHDVHILGSSGRDVEDSPTNNYLGYYLRKKYGDGYYAFSLEFNQGSYLSRVLQPGLPPGEFKEATLPPAPTGSLPWYLSRTKVGDLVLNLRTPSDNQTVEQWLSAPQVVHYVTWGYQAPSDVYAKMNIKKYYDGIVFIEKTTATRPTANALAATSKRERF